MDKLVVLELEGDLDKTGFRAALEIRSDRELHSLKVKGYLPPVPDIATHLQRHWQETYRSLGMPQRIKAQKIIYKGSINQHIAECRESAQVLRDRFRSWLDSESFQSVDRRLREELNRSDTIRFLLRTDDVNLQKLPWHEWDFFDRYPKAEVALSAPEYESIRFRNSTTLKAKNEVNILAILGNSLGINVETDRHQIEELPHAQVEFLVEPDRTQLSDRLWEKPWDILFFAGHSQTEGETGRIYINQTDSLSIAELKYGLRKAIDRGLQLAIFNSCDGLGLVQELKQLHIPQTIVMREPIPDPVAAVFLKYFLEAFSTGEPLYLAQRQARERLQGLEHQFPCASWLPVLYQNPVATPPDWFSLRGCSAPTTEPIAPASASPQPSISPAKKPRFRTRSLLWMSLATTLSVMTLRFLGLLQPLEMAAYDHLIPQRSLEKIDPRILVVEVTENDINDRGGYPLTDETLAQTIATLQSFEPAAIGIDMHRYQPRGDGRKDLIDQFQTHPNLFAVCAFNNSDKNYDPPPELSASQRIEQLGFSNLAIDRFRPIWHRGQGKTGESLPNTGRKVRRHLLSYSPNFAPTPSTCTTPYSLSFQLAFRYLDRSGIQPLTVTKHGQWQWGSVVFHPLGDRFGGYQNLNGVSNQVMLNYRNAQPGQRMTLQQLLKGQVNGDWVKDRIVLVGYTAPVARDEFETPYGEMAGVWVHAHMVSQMLGAVLEDRPLIWVLPQWRGIQWGDGLWVLAWSMGVGVLVTTLQRRSPVVLALTIAALIWGVSQICLMTLNYGGWLPLIPAVLSVFLTVSWVVFHRR